MKRCCVVILLFLTAGCGSDFGGVEPDLNSAQHRPDSQSMTEDGLPLFDGLVVSNTPLESLDPALLQMLEKAEEILSAIDGAPTFDPSPLPSAEESADRNQWRKDVFIPYWKSQPQGPEQAPTISANEYLAEPIMMVAVSYRLGSYLDSVGEGPPRVGCNSNLLGAVLMKLEHSLALPTDHPLVQSNSEELEVRRRWFDAMKATEINDRGCVREPDCFQTESPPR